MIVILKKVKEIVNICLGFFPLGNGGVYFLIFGVNFDVDFRIT